MLRRLWRLTCVISGVLAFVAWSLPVLAQTPQLTSISPDHGVQGTSITLTGSGFGAAQGNGAVQLGTLNGSVVSWSDTQIIATVTSSLSGAAKVRRDNVWSNSITFTMDPPMVAAASPTHGFAGDTMTITGSSFGATKGNYGNVRVGATYPTTYLSWSTTEIVVTIPSTVSGVVEVAQNGVWSSSGLTFAFDPPTVTSISPTHGFPGDQVTITGSHFGP